MFLLIFRLQGGIVRVVTKHYLGYGSWFTDSTSFFLKQVLEYHALENMKFFN